MRGGETVGDSELQPYISREALWDHDLEPFISRKTVLELWFLSRDTVGTTAVHVKRESLGNSELRPFVFKEKQTAGDSEL